MTTPLCGEDAQDCLGLPASSTLCPYAPVRCRSGVLVVENVKTTKGWVNSNSDFPEDPIGDASTVYGTLLEVTVTNPWCVEAIAFLSHEFGIGLGISDTDAWAYSGDISCADAVLLTGGTGAMITLYSNDGTAFTPEATLVRELALQNTYCAEYLVAAGVTATFRQQVRLDATVVNGFTRVIHTFSNTMKGILMPRETT